MIIVWAFLLFIALILFLNKKFHSANNGMINNNNDPNHINRLVEEKKSRASQLKIPELAIDIYDDYIKHYPAWFNDERNRSWVYPKVTQASKKGKDNIEIVLDGKKYLFSYAIKNSYVPLENVDEFGHLEIFLNEKLVFAIDMFTSYGEFNNSIRASGIDAFIEGDWIKDLQEIKYFHQARSRQAELERKNDPARIKKMKDNFGIS